MIAWLRLVACALLLAAPPAAAGPALERIRDSGVVVAAADPTWPPFSWRDPLGEFHGFDVEVAREIARRLGARAEFVSPSWEEQISGDWGGRWDIAVASITPTEARRARLDFPAVYSWGLAALAVPTDAPYASAEDLDGLRIAVMQDTLYEAYLRGAPLGVEGAPEAARAFEPGEILAFADSAAPYRVVSEGRIADALIDDRIAIEAQVAAGRALRIVGSPLLAAPAAVAIERGDPELSAEIARIVADMRRDGTLDALSRTWFDAEHNAALAAMTGG